MRANGLILGMVVAAASARAEADPQASESPSVASVHDGVMLAAPRSELVGFSAL
jgi:hypothetical protein